MMGPTAPAMGSASPRSQRLPSPPPFPEVQIGPTSPGMNPIQGNTMPDNEDTAKLDQGAMRRIRPGTKAADFSGPPLVPLSELDSPFQLQEHLKALHYHHTRSPNDPKMTTPITRQTALDIATPPPNVDRSLWLYELCRLLVMKANIICVCFFNEEPPCSATTCPEMRASEWQYLCAVHEPPKSCCAIDYCCHTLEWAADTLTSTKNFPSRLSLGGEAPGAAQGAVRQLTNIMRRVYRIFAHAWFSHREIFWQLENNEGLYMLFKTVCDEYHLIQEENYTVPPEAEGLAAKEEAQPEAKSVLRKPEDSPTAEAEDKTTLSSGATTRRHKHTPSMGSTVATIAEGDEDDGRSPESPTKDETSLSAAMERSTLHDSPLAQVSKAAEKEPVPAIQRSDSVVKVEEEEHTSGDPKTAETEPKHEAPDDETSGTEAAAGDDPPAATAGPEVKVEVVETTED